MVYMRINCDECNFRQNYGWGDGKMPKRAKIVQKKCDGALISRVVVTKRLKMGKPENKNAHKG